MSRVCPFCRYIGPALLCGCVTELHEALQIAAMHLPMTTGAWMKISDVVQRHEERVRTINDELQREDAS